MSDHEFVIRIDHGDGNHPYRVFASGPAGEVTGSFTLPFDERDLEVFFLRVSRGPTVTRRAESSEMQQIRVFGAALFEALFRGRVGELYRVSRALAEVENSSLRMTLALTGVPELMRLPWEYLYDDPEFVAISKWTPVVRYLEIPGAPRPLKAELPLRILAMVSSPEGVVQLDAELERANLERALRGLVELGVVEITWLEGVASLDALLHVLQGGPFHIFHFIGHGDYDNNVDDGVLLFETETKAPRPVTGKDLGIYLAEPRTIRLAVLNACDGARAASDDPFAGVATSLVQRKIPAVIAMQFAISDAAAVRFSGEFYWKLADSGSVDGALAFARQALFAAGNEVEWATPVLFMRVSDGQIFDVPEAPVPRPSVRVADQAQAETVKEPEVDGVDAPAGGGGKPPPRRRPSARVVAAIIVVAGIALAAAAFALISRGPETRTVTPPPPASPPGPPPSGPTPWKLRTAIPASIRSRCVSSPDAFVVPGSLKPLVDEESGERVRFNSGFFCDNPPVPAALVQYSLARSAHDLTRYMQSRANSAGLPAFVPTDDECGTAEKASDHWKPAGPRGHTIITSGKGSGRVICYRSDDGTPRIEWTDTRSRVYGFAEGPRFKALLRWWKTAAGPRPP